MKTEDQFQAWLVRQGKEPSNALESHKYGDPANAIKFEREKGGKMQRDVDEVELLLDLWADWMKKPEKLVAGYPEKASGGFVPSWCKDTEEAAEAADNEVISRINAAFDSLAPLYKYAIFNYYGLGSKVWRFAKDASFEDAKIVIRVQFVKRGLV